MNVAFNKYTKADYPDIEDSAIGKIIPIAYGKNASIKLQCINGNSDIGSAVYRLPDLCADIGTAYVKIDDVWKAATGTADYTAMTYTCTNGRDTSGSVRELKITDYYGYTSAGQSYPQAVLEHFIATYIGIKYNASNFDTTEWEAELAEVEADIGFTLTKEIDAWQVVFDISQKSLYPFIVDYNSSGKITAKVLDFTRASSLTVPSCDVLNQEFPASADGKSVYSSVLLKYYANTADNSALEVANDTYARAVAQEYRIKKQITLDTYLVNSADAITRSDWEALRLSQVPMVFSLELRGAHSLKRYDVITVALQPDNLVSNSRQWFGNRDMLVLSVNPQYSPDTNKITAMIIPNRTPATSQAAIMTTAYETKTRTYSSLELTAQAAAAADAAAAAAQADADAAAAAALAAQGTADTAVSNAATAQATATAATTSLAPAAIAQYNPAYTPELPDNPAGIIYYQNAFATTDSFTGFSCTLAVSGGILTATATATAAMTALRTASYGTGRQVIARVRSSKTGTVIIRGTVDGTPNIDFGSGPVVAGEWATIIGYTAGALTVAGVRQVSVDIGTTIDLDWIQIGTGAHLSPTLDTSGNGNHLTNTAAVPVSYNGRKWWAFNGATSNLVAATAILGATGFFSRRIRTPATFTEQFICGNLSGNTGCALKIMTGGTLRLAVGNGSTVVNLDTTVAASTEYWIACYIGATSATLYKDGSTSDTDTVTMSASSTAWAEGKDPASAASYWKGYTAEPYATTTLPSAAQIRDLYVNGLPAELYTPPDYRIDTFDDDGKLSVEEKAALKTRWLEIYYLTAVTSALSTTSTTKDGDFSAITAEAITAGLTAASAEVVLYVGAANAIRDFCWNSSTGVLNNMNAPSTVTAGALDELLSEYRTAYNGLKQAILNQRVTSSSTLDPIQRNGYHQIPVDGDGDPTSYVGSDNLIQVFEGITHLQATTGTPGNGEFKVVATGTNITAGAVTVSGLDAAIADASSITADAAYITFAITGKSSAGTSFAIYLSQTITKSRAGSDAVVYSLATSAGTARVNSAGTISPSTVSATRYKKVGSASKAVTTDGTLKYQRSSDASETTTSNGTGISIASTDTYIDFFFYDASSVLDVTVRVPIIVDGQIADVATYAPRYLGVGLLAANDNATFRLDTVDSAGDITEGSNTTANTGDSMVNHDDTNVALGMFVWSGTEWTSATSQNYLQLAWGDILNLSTGGIIIPGIVSIQTAIIKNIMTESLGLLTGGKLFSGVGNYNNVDTPAYLGADGKFSLGTSLTFDGTSLAVNQAEVSGTLIGGTRYDRTGTVIDQKEPGIFIKAGGKGLIGGFDFTSPYGNPVAWNPGWKYAGYNDVSCATGDGALAALTSATDGYGQHYVINYAGNGWLDLLKYDWPSLSVIATLNTGITTLYPAVAAYDEGRVAVYDAAAGTIKVYTWDEDGFSLLATNSSMGQTTLPTNMIAISTGKLAWSIVDSGGTMRLYIGTVASDGTITRTQVTTWTKPPGVTQSLELLAMSAEIMIVARPGGSGIWSVTAYAVDGVTIDSLGGYLLTALDETRLKMVALGGSSFIIHSRLTLGGGYKALISNMVRGTFRISNVETDATGGAQYGYPSIHVVGSQIATNYNGTIFIKEKTFSLSGTWSPDWDDGL